MPSQRTLKRLGFALGITACLSSFAQAQRSDSITRIAGKAIRGQIDQIAPDSITVSGSDGPAQVNPWEVRRIKFDGEPNDLTRAKSAYTEDRFVACLEALDRINETISNPFIQQDIDYFRAAATARIALGGGSITVNQAVEAMSQFLSGARTSYHVTPALDLFGDLASAAGQFDSAAEQYSKVAASPWVELSLLAAVKHGRALMLLNNNTEAVGVFSRVEASDNSADYALEARLIATCLRAQALAQSGNPEEGRKIALDIIKKEDHENRSLFARAYNALGTSYLLQGDLKQARDAFLHTDLLFYTDPDAHAEALFQLYGIWNKLDQPNRAGEARQKIKDRYRNTFWATKLG